MVLSHLTMLIAGSAASMTSCSEGPMTACVGRDEIVAMVLFTRVEGRLAAVNPVLLGAYPLEPGLGSWLASHLLLV